MKRFTSLMFCLLVMVTLLAGCGGSANPVSSDSSNPVSSDSINPVGKYVAKSIDGQSVKDYFNMMADETGMDLDTLLEYLGLDSVENFVTLEIKDGGKFILTNFEDSMEGNWTQDGNKIKLTIDGEVEEATINGDKITLVEDDSTLVLVKK